MATTHLIGYNAQADAVSAIFSAIIQANPESSVGLMSMGGHGPEVLVTLTTEHGKISEGLHQAKDKIGGDSHLVTAIQIAGVRSLSLSLSFFDCFLSHLPLFLFIASYTNVSHYS